MCSRWRPDRVPIHLQDENGSVRRIETRSTVHVRILTSTKPSFANSALKPSQSEITLICVIPRNLVVPSAYPRRLFSDFLMSPMRPAFRISESTWLIRLVNRFESDIGRPASASALMTYLG